MGDVVHYHKKRTETSYTIEDVLRGALSLMDGPVKVRLPPIKPVMRKVYIAGPYRADTPTGVMLNIRQAAKTAERLWAKGYAPLCPHLNSALMDGVAPEVFLEGDLRWLEVADMILLLPGWEKSVGARIERAYADECGLPIVYFEEIDRLPDMNAQIEPELRCVRYAVAETEAVSE